MKRSLSAAITHALTLGSSPITTKYDLWLFLLRLYAAKQYLGIPLNVRKAYPSPQDLSRVLNELTHNKFLSVDQDFSSNIFRIRDIPDGTPEELCCIIDPFCYVSHLSALQWHGFTDRHPLKLFFTTPTLPKWKTLAQKKASQDFTSIPDKFITSYPRHSIPAKVRGREIHFHHSRHFGECLTLRSPLFRIATPAQTFLDGLLEPELCGGMSHVLDIWKSHVREYLHDVLHMVDSCDSPITKVRAGYILEEMMSLSNPVIDAWKQCAQRGSSRKLDPVKPFSEKHSKTWMLSINI